MCLASELGEVVGAEHVLTDPALTAAYETDWTRRYSGRARCVVRPGSTAEVAEVVRTCAHHGVPLVPQGGNTGVVGGGVPRGGSPDAQVVLSTRRLTRLDPVEAVAGQVTVGAGVTVAALREHARTAGFTYGVDLASRDSATLGGTIATNAGGIHVIRYGDTRAQLLGVEAVLADASVVSRLGGLLKDNTGYDLTQLLAGSEGTLGIVTAARVRLWPCEPYVATVLVGVTGVEEALAIFAEVRGAVHGLRAVEYIEAAGVELVREVSGLPAPLPRSHPAYLLVEVAGVSDPLERLADLAGSDAFGEAAVASDALGRERLWAYRERHTEAISTLGIPHKLDVALPLDRLAAFHAELPKALDGRQAYLFGHLGAGNLHVNVVGPAPDDLTVDEAVFRLVAEHGGTISAEHGIGVAKAGWLGLTRSGAEVAALRRVKDAFDPGGLLNPGVLFPPPGH